MGKIKYYRCNFCFRVGLVVTDKNYAACGFKRCEKMMYLPKVKIAKQEYERVWGLSTVSKTSR